MDFEKVYEQWKSFDGLDGYLKDELVKIEGNREEIEDRFYKTLEFGTAGLRGVLGAGTNRMNVFTVRQATAGLAEYIKKTGHTERGVVIAYDSRHFSPEFALEAAKVLCANNIKVYLFESLRPTPELSFSVRHLHCIAGIVITASHNPAKYNGYKVYGEDGGQMPLDAANAVTEEIRKTDMLTGPSVMDEKEALSKGLLTYIGEDVDRKYLESVFARRVNPEAVAEVADSFSIVYTPFHGSGNKLVQRILRMSGLKNLYVVREQEEPDGDFPTVKSPNPEDKEGFKLAIELAKKNNTDLIIGTDPDSDRVGIVVRASDGEYVTMTGNQVGALLCDYLLSQPGVPSNGAVISTIVSTRLIKAICEKKNIKYFDVLTGFKFIGEKIHQFEIDNSYSYVLGLEESYGYLVGTYARDKDAVVASMLISEMAVYYSKQGKTLYDKMNEIYSEYGYFKEGVFSAELKGLDGAEKIKGIMKSLRNVDKAKYKIAKTVDYLNDDTGLPKSDVMQFEFEDGGSFIARPSGTEPKIKLYMNTIGKDSADAQVKEEALKKTALEICGL